MERAKSVLAESLDGLGLTRLMLRAQRLTSPFVRVVNYHDVPPSQAASFEEHLKFYRDTFSNVGRSELQALSQGEWKSDRPGLVISFDDGVRSHGEIAAPLLEKYGFTGWFFVPVGFIETPVAEQRAFAAEHRIQYEAAEYPEERIALGWDQIRELDARHVVGCHSWSHSRLSDDVQDVEREVLGSKQHLEAQLGHAVDSFCWVGGEDWSYGREAAALIRDAYTMSFASTSRPMRAGCDLGWIDRTHMEASYPLSWVRLSLSGIADVWHSRRRTQIRERLGV